MNGPIQGSSGKFRQRRSSHASLVTRSTGSCMPLLSCNYRVLSCALYIQLNRKRTPIKTKGPAIIK